MKNTPHVRGLRPSDEVHGLANVRSPSTPRRTIVACSLGALAVASAAFPTSAAYLATAGAVIAGWHALVALKSRRKRRPDGIFLVGNDRDTGEEIWQSRDECLQHSLVLGTTGSGKTEGLLGTVFNALATNSGAIYVDGKGDVALFAHAYSMAKQFGREDDLLVLNFMTGNRDLGRANGTILSNTFNPFASGSADMLTQMVVSLMDDAGGDGAMWKGRATAMFTGVMRALVWMRDRGAVALNVGTIRDYLNLRAIIDLADARHHPEMPASVRKSMRSYLTSLPGYQEDKGYKQSQTTLDQHGYLEMQFTKILGSLADVYGHIFFTDKSDVDMRDVYLNRRILIVMLPALEKAGDEIANLGKIVLASLKGQMGSILGSSIKGSWEEIVDRRFTASSSPLHAVFDEVGYYTVDGTALMTAQARSLDIAYTFAAQDIRAMKRLNEKEAASIIANTGTKRFMRLETLEDDDPERARYGVDAANLRNLHAGQMVLMGTDSVRNAEALYPDPDKGAERSRLWLRPNHLVALPAAPRQVVEDIPPRAVPLPGEMWSDEMMDIAFDTPERQK